MSRGDLCFWLDFGLSIIKLPTAYYACIDTIERTKSFETRDVFFVFFFFASSRKHICTNTLQSVVRLLKRPRFENNFSVPSKQIVNANRKLF